MSKKNKVASPALDKAEAEARRFLVRAAEARAAMETVQLPDWRAGTAARTDVPRENAALKRASMDLSRALAALRTRNNT